MIVWHFIKWILAQMGEGLLNQHKHFCRGLKNETGLHIFVWFIVSIVSSLVVFVLLVVFQSVTDIVVPIQVWGAYIASCVIYLVYTGFSLMYTAFKAERAQLFETIKTGR